MPVMHRIQLTFAILILLLARTVSASIDVADTRIEAALVGAGDNRAEIQRALSETPDDQRRYMRWLVAHMPPQDLQSLDAAFLLNNCDLACRAWRAAPWHGEIDEAMFVDTILPYASVNERREDWRTEFMERFTPLVADAKTPGEAAAMLNNRVFPMVGVIYSTKRPKADQSPYESIEAGMASCTGLSVILVDACRSVGVPARFVGTPLWSDQSGNHSWVEVWDDGDWHFTGAAEPSGMELDRAWFTGRAATATRDDPLNAIYAVTWADSPIHFPMSWRLHDTSVGGIDVTDRYTVDRQPVPEGMARVRFRVVDEDDRRIRTPVRIEVAGMDPMEIETRDERFDANDHAEVLLPLGSEASAVLGHGARSMPFSVERDEQLVSMRTAGTDESKPLSRAEAEAVARRLWDEHEDMIRRTRRAEHEARLLSLGDHEMKYWYEVHGDAPAEGRSLYISMHGGGGAPAEVNEQQWNNQKRLYTPDEGVYLVPRAPTNTWNMWHQGHVDDFYDRLIENMIVFENVDPDRVYLMGYSAGGDGVYQLAPRMADRFGAAAMMAGHPNETNPAGLRNLPFTLHMGGEDGAYNRNNIARDWKDRLAALRRMDPGGYVHHVEIHEGKGHWMEREDAVAVPWMAGHDRDLRPEAIVWLQDDVVHDRFYWLAVDEPAARRRIVVSRKGQVLRIHTAGGAKQLKFRLDDSMLDLDRDVVVRMAGKTLFKGRVPRTTGTIRRTLAERGDPDGIFTAELVVDLSEEDAVDTYEPGAVDIDVDGAPRTYRYRLRRPEGEAPAPLVVFLHGMGERGSDNLAQLGHFPHRVLREDHFRDKRCFVLAPQCPEDDSWARWREPDNPDPTDAMRAAIAAIDQVMAEERIDPDRVYLLGLSMGGYGTWDLAARQPERFAAIVPVCGGGDPSKMERLVGLPTWVFHGTADRVVPEARSLVLVEALREAGGDPKYSALPGVGHNSWDTAFGPAEDGGAMDWLFEQRRDR